MTEPPPRKRPTLAEVAAEAGVSAATVSRALARPEMLSESTLHHILDTVRRMGYVPTAAARALALGRTSMIGAIVPSLDSAIFSRALETIQMTLADEGYRLVIASHAYSPSAEVEVARALIMRGVEGLILVGADHRPELWQMLEQGDVPAVLTWCGDPRFDSVVIDNAHAGRVAADHLLDLGHRRIGVITGALASNDRQRQRVQGIHRAMEGRGRVLSESFVVEQPFTLAGGRLGAAALLSLSEPPTAIICGTDIAAVGALAEAHDRGLAVPGDLSVMGIDNLDMAAHVSPALTTVHVPTTRIGHLAAMCLVERLRGNHTTPQTIELPIELVQRRSTGVPL
jgi:LacI family transcriptional regulator